MKKYLSLGALALALVLIGAGCVEVSSSPTTAVSLADEQKAIKENQTKLATAVPLPKLDNSLERVNIKKRLETFDDPNKVSYIYLVNYGRVMSFYTIKGKVTSSHKRLTTKEKFERCDTGEWDGDCTVEAPSLDGSYGDSDSYVFFWTTDGVYVQWSGDYMLVDQPLRLTTQPELVREVK